ncbi:magnesium transporter [Rhodobacterales bacterium HKCCE2091]|nr:magnesium transporter [Rhodobacterales bacterium HKCCE2091]
MISAYRAGPSGLQHIDLDREALTEGAAVTVPEDAVWIDLVRPLPAHADAAARFGVEIPSLEDMREIEVSNRLYRQGGAEYMTVVLPGFSESHEAMVGPVSFILTSDRLVTVRHHRPKPFDTFPLHAGQSSSGCRTAERVFLGLMEEVTGRLADLLEGAGDVLDAAARQVFGGGAQQNSDLLQETLERVGRQGELLNRVRLAVLTLDRALSFFATIEREQGVKALTKGLTRDLASLTVHADFLSSRVGLTVDATLGMINLAQNATVRIVSVVAALFLPPTLVASIYGMNFGNMPELHQPWGYAAALAAMFLSAVGTYLWFRWKKWL